MIRSRRLLVLIIILLLALGGLYYQLNKGIQIETIQFTSSLNGRVLPYKAVLPPGYGLITSRRTHYPVIYLLHGWSGHFDSWLSNTGLAQYAAQHKFIIITPEGNNGWYSDSATNPSEKYESYIISELIPDVDRRFRTIPDRRGRGIAGNSMGGYGALKVGFKYPSTFAFVASMSGALDAPNRVDDKSIMDTFGAAGSLVRSDNDLEQIVRRLAPGKGLSLPFVYMDCGLDDPWLNVNDHFSDVLSQLKVRYAYRRVPGGHVWSYWDSQVQDVLGHATEVLSGPE